MNRYEKLFKSNPMVGDVRMIYKDKFHREKLAVIHITGFHTSNNNRFVDCVIVEPIFRDAIYQRGETCIFFEWRVGELV